MMNAVRVVVGALKHHATLTSFVLLILILSVLLPETFLTGRNLFNITQQMSMLMVTAAAMTIVMAMGDYDLSVGSLASLVGIVAAVTFKITGSEVTSLVSALAVGLISGAFNGILISGLNILPFVATLGSLTIFSGLAFLIAGGKTLFGREIPPHFTAFARGGIPIFTTDTFILTVPHLTVTAASLLALVWFLLQKTIFGRHLYAIGGNAEASRLAGIDVSRTRFIGFVLSGMGASLAGLMYMSRVASANPTQGAGLMLDAMAAVFIGMTMNPEGEPKILNTLIGVLFLGVLSNGLTQLNIDSYVRDILVGALIIIAVSASRLEKLSR